MASYLDPVTTIAGIEDPYAMKMRRGFLDSAYNLANQPTPVPVQQVAGFDPLEQQARQLSGGLGGFQPFLQGGANMAQQGFNTLGLGTSAYGRGAQSLNQAGQMFNPNAASAFYNPFEQDVVQQTIRDMTERSDIAGVGDRFNAVRSGAFGGSRGRIMESERERSLGRGLGEAIGGIRSQGFNLAQQAAQNAGSGLTQIGGQFGQFGQGFGNLGQAMSGVGQQFAGLGTTGQANLQNQINSLSGLGAIGRNLNQSGNDARFNAAQQAALEPRQRLTTLQSMLGMLPRTSASTVYKANAGVDPIAGLISLLNGGRIT